jgi:hypothetical protein
MSDALKLSFYCSEHPGCICDKCLYNQSGRCPHGECYDDLRAIENPYDKAHPDEPPRTSWSDWKEDQAYWCRGGIFYQTHECDRYVEYDESKLIIRDCLIAVVGVYQDGYIHCSLIESVGCEECMKQFNERVERKEVEEMPKQIFWTKCGRQFEKNSTAVVTGYTIEENDMKLSCNECPFKVEVKEGWPPVFKRWECRAGSKEPNHTNEWTGSLESKTGLDINSLDHNFLESVIEYCKEQPDIAAGYNADHLADCRRTVSVSCSQNKKGIAAKKALVEKFFPKIAEVPDDRYENDGDCYYCENCIHSEDYGESVEYIKCAAGAKQKDVKKKQAACANYVPTELFEEQKCRVCGCTDNNACEGGCSWVEDDLCSRCAGNSCDATGCPFNNGNGSCCFADEDPETDGYHRDVIGAVDGYECKNEDVLLAYKIISDPDSCDVEMESTSDVDIVLDSEKPEEKEIHNMRIDKSQECRFNNLVCPCYCAHNAGCALLLMYGDVLEDFVKEHNADCEVFREISDRILAKPEIEESINKEETGIDLQESANVPVFDYSTVDEETAHFLQEKANKITEIRIKSVIALGKEFKEVNDRLASHNKYEGVFGKWTESLGMSRMTINRYINAYDYVVTNCYNIEDAEKIQPSLLFAASKPSAPKELSDKVASGDITTHKQYKDLEDKLKEAEKQAERAQKLKWEADNKAIQAEQDLKKAQKERSDSIRAFEKDINNLNQQLDQAKRNADPAKVKELGKVISEKQQEIDNYQKQIGNLNQQLQQTRQQLHDKPIEVPATRVKEVLSDDVRFIIYHKIEELGRQLFRLSAIETKVFVEVGSDYLEDFIQGLRDTADRFEEVSKESTPCGRCGACEYADMDKLPEEDLDNDKTWCTLEDVVVDFNHRCGRFERVGGSR